MPAEEARTRNRVSKIFRIVAAICRDDASERLSHRRKGFQTKERDCEIDPDLVYDLTIHEFPHVGTL